MSGGGMLGGFLENRKLKQKRRMAHRLGYQGLQAMARNDPDSAERSLNAALTVFQELGDRGEEATTHTHLASLHQHRSEFDDAEENLRIAMALFEQVGDTDGLATAWSNIGIISLSREAFDEAEQQFHEALKLYRDSNNREGVAHSHGGIGLAQLGRKEFDVAIAGIKRSVEKFDEIDQRHGLAPMLVNLGEAYVAAGDPESAREHWEHAQEIYQMLKAPEAVEQVQKRIDETFAPDEE